MEQIKSGTQAFLEGLFNNVGTVLRDCGDARRLLNDCWLVEDLRLDQETDGSCSGL